MIIIALLVLFTILATSYLIALTHLLDGYIKRISKK